MAIRHQPVQSQYKVQFAETTNTVLILYFAPVSSKLSDASELGGQIINLGVNNQVVLGIEQSQRQSRWNQVILPHSPLLASHSNLGLA